MIEEFCVVVGVFLGTPMPGDDVVGGAGDQETLGVEVGAVDEDLILDSLLINASGRLDKPERFEPALQSS